VERSGVEWSGVEWRGEERRGENLCCRLRPGKVKSGGDAVRADIIIANPPGRAEPEASARTGR